VLFYNFGYYLEHPLSIPFIWEGGMSFHGGLLGVVVVCVAYARRHKFHFLALGDILGTVVPIGLFFGRIANFINGELYGRISTAPWAVIFPRGGDLPRHPSQLYEALLEGLCLFIVMVIAARNPVIRRTTGLLFGIFVTGYSLSRFAVEFFREPDPQVGFIFEYFTLGQLLTLPMIAAGLYIIQYARKHKAQA
jgi:phosphatidylglycerol:prolipoprotein diacylglycerol transferase